MRVGDGGAAPLLDWLGVQRRHRYARASALDEGEASLTGMLLLDLPDHDSVVTGSAAMVDRLVKLADMLVWVLDPLKYADASVHRRYLVPLAGHAAVTTVVLNQADTLSPDQVADCESDLRRLLDSEGLSETPVLMTSATTGAGLQGTAPRTGRLGGRPAGRERQDRRSTSTPCSKGSRSTRGIRCLAGCLPRRQRRCCRLLPMPPHPAGFHPGFGAPTLGAAGR